MARENGYHIALGDVIAYPHIITTTDTNMHIVILNQLSTCLTDILCISFGVFVSSVWVAFVNHSVSTFFRLSTVRASLISRVHRTWCGRLPAGQDIFFRPVVFGRLCCGFHITISGDPLGDPRYANI